MSLSDIKEFMQKTFELHIQPEFNQRYMFDELEYNQAHEVRDYIGCIQAK